MYTITEDLQRDKELVSPPSLKRPRTICTVTNEHSVESRFDFLEILTFHKTTEPPSSQSIPQNNVVLIYTAENNDSTEEKHYNQPQDIELIVTPNTAVAASCSDDADRGLSQVCVSSAERKPLDLEKYKQPNVSQNDKICSCPLDDAGGASENTSTDTFSHPDYKRLEKSLENEAPSDCCLPAGNQKDGRQVQQSVIQIQASPLNSSDDEVRCQCDCSYENVPNDVIVCNTWSQSVEVEVSNHKRDEQRFNEHINFSREEKDEGYSPISSNNIPDCKSFHSYSEEDLSGNVAEYLENEERVLQLQICENEYLAVCDGETKGQVNENGMSKNSILSIAEFAEGSLVFYDVVLAKNTATENVSLESDDLCGAKGEHAAGKMIAKAWNETTDHTTETPVSAQISREPAEGDDNVGLFRVTDPAVWRETDKEPKEKSCNSASIASVELSPSITVCKMETALPVCFDVRPSQEVSAFHQTRQCNHKSTTEQCKDDPESCTIITNEMHSKTAVEGSSPHRRTNPASALDGKQESYMTVGLQLKEQDQSDSFPISHDNLRTREAEHSQTEIARTTEIIEREEIISFKEIKTEHGDSEKDVESVEHLQQNHFDKEDTTEIAEEEFCECDLTVDLEKKLSDHIYSADISQMTTVNNEGKDVTCLGEEMKTKVGELKDDLQEQSEHKSDKAEVSHVQYIGEWTEGNISTSGNKLTLVSGHEHGNKFGSCFHYQQRVLTYMVENTDDLMAFTSPLTSDAVVPCSSQNANNHLPAPNCTVSCSLLPSDFAFPNQMPKGEFYSFDKVPLSPDDDDCMGSSLFLISEPGQVSKTPQRQLSHLMPKNECAEYDQTPEEEEERDMETTECHTDYTANGFLNVDISCKELPNLDLGWPEQQPDCESTCDSCEPIQGDSESESTESHSPASDVKDFPEFEMKNQFDMVLKELNLFFDISKSDFTSNRSPSHEQCCDISEPSEAKKEHLCSTDVGCHTHTSTDDGDEDRSLEMCSSDPVVSCNAECGDSEQEVPLCSPMCPKKSVYPAEKHKEPWEMEQKRKMWSPSFMCLPLLEQLSHRLAEPPKRLEPLRTCARPIRVGLSKRAKTKQLHRAHPYK